MVFDESLESVVCRRYASKQMKICMMHVNILLLAAIISFIVSIMAPPPKCCNPLQKKNHNNVKNKLYYFTNDCDQRFSALFGSYVCNVCKVQLYKNKDSFQLKKVEKCVDNQSAQNKQQVEEDDEEMEKESTGDDDNDKTYVCKAVDNRNKKLKLAATLQEAIMAPSSSKSNLQLTNADSEILRNSLSYNVNIFSDLDCNWVYKFKEAMSNASTREQKRFY